MIVALERAVADFPFTVLMTDQAAVHLVLHRKTGQFVRGERVDKILNAAL